MAPECCTKALFSPGARLGSAAHNDIQSVQERSARRDVLLIYGEAELAESRKKEDPRLGCCLLPVQWQI
ncbi:hypothetical protein NDU88_011094 [Pleurodeles waltl]|uniref:Uncharacterized protein n=1 Tax=Pleurodeles waltl TaxID=8319 RepID=A0AAV7R0L2_PLEWA|nr:hypothetical protein NDU88_011094 [Pleurodeles waltl]